MEIATLEAPKKRVKAELLEWIDPSTNEVHVCPKKIVKGLLSIVRTGSENAKTASQILNEMNLEDSPSNQRHLRQAALFLKHRGIPLIAYRSSKGGYFVAGNEAAIQIYAEDQTKIAQSMFDEIKRLKQIRLDEVNAIWEFLQLNLDKE